MTWGIALGLGASLGWGTSAFLAGRLSGRFAPMQVTIWSQLVGGVLLLATVLLAGGPLHWGGFGWGMIAGLFGSTALVLFYGGIARGSVSIVTAVGSCGALVPVFAGLAQGTPLTWAVALGIALSLVGIVLVSLHEAQHATDQRHQRGAMLYALGAALGFGMFFVFAGRGTNVAGDGPLWVTMGARTGGTALLLLIQAVRARTLFWPGAGVVPLGVIGIIDTSASALFTLATLAPNLGVVAVIGSLYPVVTVLLSRLFLAERLTLTQYGGIALALLGVVLLTVG